jgi:hypothetical protein
MTVLLCLVAFLVGHWFGRRSGLKAGVGAGLNYALAAINKARAGSADAVLLIAAMHSNEALNNMLERIHASGLEEEVD